MLHKISKYFFVTLFTILILSLAIITLHSDFRRTLLNYFSASINVYQLVSIQVEIKKKDIDFEEGSNKILSFLELQKKYINGRSKFLIGTYDALKLLESKAVTRNNYLKLERPIKKILEIDPNIFEARNWLAKNYYYKKKYNLALNEIDKSIEIAPLQDDAYRIAMKISEELQDDNIFNKYCKIYFKTNSGGTTKRYKSTFFGGITNNTFGLSTKDSSGLNSEIYPISGLVLDNENEFEITLLKPTTVKDLDIFLSFTPGIKIVFESLKLVDGNSNIFEVDTKNLTILSNNSFLLKDTDQTEIVLSSLDDEILTLSLAKEYKNISQVIINAKFKKLNLINRKCR